MAKIRKKVKNDYPDRYIVTVRNDTICAVCHAPIPAGSRAVYDPLYIQNAYMHDETSQCYHWDINKVIAGLDFYKKNY